MNSTTDIWFSYLRSPTGTDGWPEIAVVKRVKTGINDADTPSTSNKVSHLGELL